MENINNNIRSRKAERSLLSQFKNNSTQTFETKTSGIHFYILSELLIFLGRLQQQKAVMHSSLQECFTLAVTNPRRECIESTKGIIMMLVQKILGDRTIQMKQVVCMARQNKLKNQCMVQMIQTLKLRLKSNPISTSFFHYLIHTADQQILEHMEDFQLALISKNANLLLFSPIKISQKYQSLNQNSIIEILDDQISINPEKLNSFQKQMKDLKRFQDKQRKIKGNYCHSCTLLMPKQLQFYCITCKNKVCFSCIERSLPNSPKDREQYLTCLICSKTCKCSECNKQNLSFSMNNPNEKLGLLDIQPEICTVCQIQGRKNQRIRVMCQRCNFSMCYFCSNGNHNGIYNEWLCNNCNSNFISAKNAKYLELVYDYQKEDLINKDKYKRKYEKIQTKQYRQRTRDKDFRQIEKETNRSNSSSKNIMKRHTYKQNVGNNKKYTYTRNPRSSSSSSSSSSPSSSPSSSTDKKSQRSKKQYAFNKHAKNIFQKNRKKGYKDKVQYKKQPFKQSEQAKQAVQAKKLKFQRSSPWEKPDKYFYKKAQPKKMQPIKQIQRNEVQQQNYNEAQICY